MKKILSKNKISRGFLVLMIVVAFIMTNVVCAENKLTKSDSSKLEKTQLSFRKTIATSNGGGFEDGIMPPPGWTIISHNEIPYTWHIVNATTEPDHVHNGEYAGAVKMGAPIYDEWLISPYFDLTDYHGFEVSLEFWANSCTIMAGATMEVIIQGDDIYDAIWDMIEDEDWPEPMWRLVTLNLSDYVGGIINISWHYIGSVGWDFYLDDIIIYLEGGPPYPEIGDITGGLSQVCAEIQNGGYANADNINWSIKMKSSFFPTWWKEWNGTIPDLHAGESEIVCTDGFIFGFGKVDIEVAAIETHYGYSDIKTVEGFVFICYIFIL